MEAFTGIDQRVKVHLTYAGVFGDALTEVDLIRHCGPQHVEAVQDALAALVAEGSVERHGDRYRLAGLGTNVFGAGASDQRTDAEGILRDNRRSLGLVARLPWVRLLAVSGSLAHDNPRSVEGKRPDIDLFVICEPSAVHIVRFIGRILIYVRAVTARARRSAPPLHLCFNYVTDASFLEVSNPSLFTAHEALHVRLLAGRDEYQRFLAANPWIGRYFASFAAAESEPVEIREPGVVRGLANLGCFCIMALGQWVKGRLIGRPFYYSLRPAHHRRHSLLRAGFSGGGYQPQIASRFREIYRHHFGPDEGLQQFLFPDTTSTGLRIDGRDFESHVAGSLAFDE